MEPAKQHHAIKKIAYGACALILCGYIALFVNGPQGWHSLRQKWNQIDSLEKDNADLKQNVETIRKYNERVKTDKDAQQLEIRKNLDMMREGELEFRYPVPPSAPAYGKP